MSERPLTDDDLRDDLLTLPGTRCPRSSRWWPPRHPRRPRGRASRS
ncbi:MAG: hypothetical protein R2734_06745 [Nocardioides sp.]